MAIEHSTQQRSPDWQKVADHAGGRHRPKPLAFDGSDLNEKKVYDARLSNAPLSAILPDDANAVEAWQRLRDCDQSWMASHRGVAYQHAAICEEAEAFATQISYLLSSMMHANTQKDHEWVDALVMLGASHVEDFRRSAKNSHDLARVCQALANGNEQG